MRHAHALVGITLVAAGFAVVTSVRADPPSPGPARQLLTISNRQSLASPRLMAPAGLGAKSARRREKPIILAPTPATQGAGNPLFPPGCVFCQDYSSYEIGDTLEDPFILIADNAFYKSIGGVPPVGNAPNGAAIDRYILFARRTIGDGGNTGFGVGANLTFPEPLFAAVEIPLQLSQLVYMPTDDGQPRTSTWWSPVSFIHGFVTDRVFFGGTNLGGEFEFAQNELGVLDRFISSGVIDPWITYFFASSQHPNFPFPVDQWFTLMLNISQTPSGSLGQSTWVKSNDTASSNPPFIDPRMASGDIIAPDGDPVGWVNTYPGHEDDPATPAVFEGIGIAATQFGKQAQTTGAYEQVPLLVAFPLDGVQLGIGLDPAGEPDFIPNDYIFGPACLNGQGFVGPCPIPDFTLAYTDDLEDWVPGPVELQSTRWLDDSTAVIVTNQNTTPGGSQSIGQQNINNDDIFRLNFRTGLPTRAVAQTGAPLVVSSQVRLSFSNRTTRSVALRDSQWEVDFAARVFLGGIDPTAAIRQSDDMVYVRQPNPAFDPALPALDNMVQTNWIDPTMWTTPPDPPLNLRYLLVPTGATVPTSVFREVRIEIEPNAMDPDLAPTMRVFYGGAELFPNGDSSQQWTAGSRTADFLEFWSGSEQVGKFDIIHVDDVQFDGPRRQVGAGPLFMAPYFDGFELYTPTEPIDGQSATPFLDPASVPVGVITQNDPQLSIMPSASAPTAGELVCRYQLTEICLDEQGLLPPVDSVIAISLAPLPPPPPGFGEQQCPGFQTSPFLNIPMFELRTPDANVRIGVGRWQLLNDNFNPEPFDPALGDVTGFDYLFTLEPRWRVETPMSQAQIVTDAPDGVTQALRMVNPGGIDGSLDNFPLFDMVSSILPDVQAHAEDFPAQSFTNEVSFDLFIESVDETGQPILAAPRTRLALPINSAEPNSGRITEIIFGGPNVPGVITAENISYRSSTNNDVFIDTNVSLLSGGGGVTGPLVNAWFRVIVSVDDVGSWALSIDEDRDGPLAPVEIAQGDPLDAHNPAGNPPVDLSRLASFQLRQGRDVGGGGEPTSAPITVQLQPGGWRAIGPSDADPLDDYCFYQTNYEEFASPTNPPIIADWDTNDSSDGVFIGTRELGPFNDVIAVLNRRTNPDNTVAGMPLVHDPCPPGALNLTDHFKILSEDGSELVYQGRWQIMGLPDETGYMQPPPAGGISRPDGTSQHPPVSYNNPLDAPPGFPGNIVSRAIILADWAFDGHDGVPPFLIPLPASRWFVDNLSIAAVEGPPLCANLTDFDDEVNGADLAILLASWNADAPQSDPYSPSDFNNDGFVNGFDLATLLANWGPCP